MNNYKFIRVRLNIRWVDYCRIRAVFPALKGESVCDYFRRFALWLEVNKELRETLKNGM